MIVYYMGLLHNAQATRIVGTPEGDDKRETLLGCTRRIMGLLSIFNDGPVTCMGCLSMQHVWAESRAIAVRLELDDDDLTDAMWRVVGLPRNA